MGSCVLLCWCRVLAVAGIACSLTSLWSLVLCNRRMLCTKNVMRKAVGICNHVKTFCGCQWGALRGGGSKHSQPSEVQQNHKCLRFGVCAQRLQHSRKERQDPQAHGPFCSFVRSLSVLLQPEPLQLRARYRGAPPLLPPALVSRYGRSAGEECRLESSLRQQHARRWYCCCFISCGAALAKPQHAPTAMHQPQRDEWHALGARKAALGGPGYSARDGSGTWRGFRWAIRMHHRGVAVVPLEITGALGHISPHCTGLWPLSKHHFPLWKAVNVLAYSVKITSSFCIHWVLATTYLAWSQSHCLCLFLIWHHCTQWAALLQNEWC